MKERRPRSFSGASLFQDNSGDVRNREVPNIEMIMSF